MCNADNSMMISEAVGSLTGHGEDAEMLRVEVFDGDKEKGLAGPGKPGAPKLIYVLCIHTGIGSALLCLKTKQEDDFLFITCA